MRGGMIEDMSALLILEGQELHLGVGGEQCGQIGRLTVHERSDMLAFDRASLFRGVIDGHGRSALKAAVCKRNVHVNPSVLKLVRFTA